MGNQINVISPYLWNSMWVFDDEKKELDKEPFVAGADTMLDFLTEHKYDSCNLIFSKDPFKGHQHQISKSTSSELNWHGDPNIDGTDYEFVQSDLGIHDLWLCPALLKYFDTPPDNIYFKVDNLEKKGVGARVRNKIMSKFKNIF